MTENVSILHLQLEQLFLCLYINGRNLSFNYLYYICNLENIIFLLITKYPERDATFPNFFFCGWQLFALDFSNTIGDDYSWEAQCNEALL